jgi:hypothetical protein
MNGIDLQEMYRTDQAIAITNRGMWQIYHNRAEDGLVEGFSSSRFTSRLSHSISASLAWEHANLWGLFRLR